MGAEHADVYILRPDDAGDDDSWVTPQPASDVVIDVVAEEVDGDADEFDDLSAYVDAEDLAAVFDGDDDSITFDVESTAVTVHASGDIDVDAD
jgi:hypothetical protein